MPNQGYHHENLKSELVRNGLLLLDQEGYEGFSLRKVAKACHVSQTAPYRHFKNKDELITAIVAEAMQAFNQILEEAASAHPEDPKKQLKEMGIAYIRFFTEHPEYMHLLFSSDLLHKINTNSGGDGQKIGDQEDHFEVGHPFSTFYRTVQNFAAAAGNSSLNRDELVLYCWGLVHGISVLLSSREKFPFQGDFLALAENIISHDNFLK